MGGVYLFPLVGFNGNRFHYWKYVYFFQGAEANGSLSTRNLFHWHAEVAGLWPFGLLAFWPFGLLVDIQWKGHQGCFVVGRCFVHPPSRESSRGQCQAWQEAGGLHESHGRADGADVGEAPAARVSARQMETISMSCQSRFNGNHQYVFPLEPPEVAIGSIKIISKWINS